MRVDHYNSGDFSEKLTTLNVPASNNNSDKRVLYSIPITDLTVGDIIQVGCEFEVTNNLGFNVMIGSCVILGDSPIAIRGTEITEPNGFNVTKNMHHGAVVKTGSHVVTRVDRKYLNTVIWSVSDAARPGDQLKVEQDYGRLYALIFRKDA